MADAGPSSSDATSANAGLRDVLDRITAVSRRMLAVSQPLAEEYDLAPRGLWILGRVRSGFVHPADLAREFHVGRSLVTAEAQRLIAAGLLASTPDPLDARRARLSLTPEGEAVYRRMWERLESTVGQSLGRHSPSDRAAFLRVLTSLAE